MDLEDSIVIREFARRLNAHVAQTRLEPSQDEIVDIERDMFWDENLVPASLHAEIMQAFAHETEARGREENNLHDALTQLWGSAFDALDECITYAAFLNSHFLKTIGHGYEVLARKNPRPRGGNGPDGWVTGAMLKCILLVSLLARSSSIASEISCLLRRSLLDGAQSRLRSLYEQTVVITLLCNDHTYELAERYQDHACFEVLKELRTHKRVLNEPIWEQSPGRDEDLARRIAQAERDANAARRRWGREIGEQYGWVRPALTQAVLGHQIKFSDLAVAAGADHLRGDYLTQNNYVHAGSYATINHFMSASDLKIFGRREDDTTRIIGLRTIFLLRFSAHTISLAVSSETEQYDEMLYACEITPRADGAEKLFNECFARAQTNLTE